MLCKILNCKHQLWANKLCRLHDHRLRQYGRLDLLPKRSALERFEALYIPEPNTGCWIWFGKHDSKDYGGFWYNNKTIPAHIWSYEYFTGKSAKPTLDHLCRNHWCVNPRHLEPVTR